MNTRGFLFSLAALAGLAGCLGPVAHAQVAADTALVVNLTGNASYRGPQGGALPLQSFLRLRRGDAIEVGANAKVGIAYMATGLVENWTGPAQFQIGEMNSTPGTGAAPQTRQLPRALLERLSRAPELLADLKNRQGLVITRELAPPEPAPVRQARADLQAVASQGDAAAANDLPELNLFFALYEARQYRSANTMLEELQRKRPNDAMVAALAQEFQRLYRRPAP